ncbi:RluA family pseudouridine synthase [Thermodesulfobacterium sp. TA1]|uniref:RluA family pseudouridine synthase n=1 Tax=Thermodesulfobacterium sp. TA1 TaxID=2234087 RepID=UPI0012318BD9|nr:RluA family pseudouridine synthase [Thermodesulfobacterium sp. TA1]QER41388.1 RluA family pseudouridine synthase [Thermodesulfobacterium sp. TA1]
MEERIFEFKVEELEVGKRLDLFLKEKLPDLSRSRLQELIEASLVQVNERVVKPSYKIKLQDLIRIKVPTPQPLELKPKDVPFDIIYEDEHIAVINKPSGVVVHPAPGHQDDTLVHGLLKKLQNLSEIGGKIRPGIVHRLDKDTSGIMLIAKNNHSHRELVEAFKQKQIEKTYIAIVYKHLKPKQGRIETFIGRHPVHRKKMAVLKEGKLAITLYEVKEYLYKASLVLAKPITGRTHQLRVHFSHLGHPILGDPVYGGLKTDVPKPQRLMLHALRIKFLHPKTNLEMEFETPIPEDFKNYLTLLKK